MHIHLWYTNKMELVVSILLDHFRSSNVHILSNMYIKHIDKNGFNTAANETLYPVHRAISNVLQDEQSTVYL